MKTVLLLGGPAAGQRAEIHGTMAVWISGDAIYKIVPMCSHGEVHWFGVLPGADPLALLIAGYAAAAPCACPTCRKPLRKTADAGGYAPEGFDVGYHWWCETCAESYEIGEAA